MTDLKTQKNDASVDAFLATIEDTQKGEDAFALKAIFEEVTQESACMWGDAIIGFGEYHYKYKSGQESDWLLVGFSPRKQNLTLYLSYGFEEDTALLDKLGKHKTGKSCLYIKKLADADLDVLRQLIKHSLEKMKALYPKA